MNIILGLIGVAGVGALVLYIKSKWDEAQIQKLDVKKATQNTKLTLLKTEELNLQSTAQQEESNLTEQQKTDFWSNELNDKKDN